MSEPKKRILIVNSHFGMGGIESALVSMANILCERYEVDLLMYYPEGPIKERLDPRVNIIDSCFALKAMGMSVPQALKSKNILIILFRILGSVWSAVFSNRLPIWLATKIQPKLLGYDLAIAYRPETFKKSLGSGYVRVMCRCTEAKVKAAWIHFDSHNFDNDRKFNLKYYDEADIVVGVSESVAAAFKDVNPSLAHKTDYCRNFIEFEKLFKKSEEVQQIAYPEGKFICFSASRLGPEKGFLRAISALSPVMKEHNDIMWYIAGDGKERSKIEEAIKENGLQERIILLGNQNNPYPYMKNADLYFSLSFHEAAPVVYAEAKALGVPVFTTETSSSREMLNDGQEDFICENSEDGIRLKFSEIMKERDKIKKAKKLITENTADGNEESYKKINKWLNTK